MSPWVHHFKSMLFAGHMMIQCHSEQCTSPHPTSHTAHTLLTFNIGIIIALRKQKGAAQGMQWLLQKYKHGLHWNRLQTLYKH